MLLAALIPLATMEPLNRPPIAPMLTLRRDLALAGKPAACDETDPAFTSLAYPHRGDLGEAIAP